MTSPVRSAARRSLRAALVAVALLLPLRLPAQVRERPVPFDSAGRVQTMTPPLAARLGLSAPAWPVTGDYVDARLFAIGEAGDAFVIVVRRQRDAVDRYALTAAQREELAAQVSRADVALRTTNAPDTMPTIISEPVRGQFIANQTALAAILFGPAASALTDDAAVGGATWLLVTGGTFFYSTALTQSTPVSRAQNHLATHSAFRGAIGANLALLALGGERLDDKAYIAATLAGGVAGDVIGFQLARPMTDAEAHGTSHGSTVAAALTAGAFGMFDAYDDAGTGRLAAGSVVAAGALGYPLGLRYVRAAPYRVTAGDVGTMLTAELLGLGVAGTFIPDHASATLGFGMLTAGYAAGAIAGDRLLVRPFDHTDSEARLLGLGAGAGALIGLALPSLASADDARLYSALGAAGGILGAVLTERLIAPARARPGDRDREARRTGSAAPAKRPSRLDVRFSPEAAVLAGSGMPGRHSLLSIGF